MTSPVDTREVRRILRSAMPTARRAIPGLAAGIATGVSIVALLATSAWLIVRAAEQPPVLFLTMAAVSVRAFALSRAVFRYLERLFSHDAVFRQLATLRVDVLNRLIPRAPAGLTRRSGGTLLSAIVSDVDELQNLSLRVVQPLVVAVTVAIAAVLGVALLSPGAAAVLVVALICAGAASIGLGNRVAGVAERSLAPRRAELADAVLDYTQGFAVLTHFGAEPAARARVAEADRALTRTAVKRARGAGVSAAVIALASGMAVAGAVLAGSALVGSGGTGGPEFAVVALVPLAVFEVVATVPVAISHWRTVRSSAERLATVIPLELPAEIPAVGASRQADGHRANTHLVLADVSARWPGEDTDSVSAVNLDVPPGTAVHVSGASGSGKTTLANVLVRFLEHRGSYTIGGVEARNPSDVRALVGLCEQHPYLFDESIRQNLLFARDTASDAELNDVLGRVGLVEWARERGGLDARVGERGALVSGGQAQRLSLARALLRDFPILVLDEPTANVDAERAAGLLVDMVTAATGSGRSIIVISHDEISHGLVDVSMTMSEGRLVTRYP